jgi:TonB-dependent receptor
MRRFFCGVFVLALMIGVVATVPVAAQTGKGTMAGTVLDSAKNVLVGAVVQVSPSGQRAVSDDQGNFRIPDVPAGQATVTVSYVGFGDFTATVNVVAGQTATLNASLQVASRTDQMIVTAERLQGEAEAINVERTADDIVQVLPLKVITSLPNTNVADAVGRLPSVTLERDEGEGKYVQIRGTEPRLTNMMINGVEVPSPEAQVRNIKMDAIPADLVDRIELSKTLSANQDADAIGGTVNLVTKTAGEKAYYSFDGQGGYTPIQGGRTLGGGGGSVGKRFGVRKQLGLFFGGTVDRNNRGIDDLEPGQAIAFDSSNPSTNVAYISTEDRRTYEYYRTRYGFDTTLDYTLSSNSSVYAKGFYSDFHDYGDVWVYSPNATSIASGNPGSPIKSVSGSQVNFWACTEPNAPAGCTPGFAQYRHYVRRPDQQVFSFLTGARHDLSTMLIHYEFAVSRGHNIGGQDFPTTFFAMPNNIQYGLDLSDPRIPRLNPVDGTNVFDPSQYTLDTVNNNDQSMFNYYHATQLNFQGSAAVARRYNFGSHFGTFEVGFLARNAHKYQVENDQLFMAGPGGLSPNFTLAQVLGTYSNPTYYSPNNTNLPIGPFSDYSKINSLVSQNLASGGLVLDSSRSNIKNFGATWDLNERVYAGYLMNNITFGKASFQTGLRIEGTSTGYNAYQVNLSSKTFVNAVQTPGSSSYINVLPTIQFKYLLTPNTNLRASFGMGISRPNFQDQVPSEQLDPNTTPKTEQIGNPALKPTRANNYDLLVEHFFQPLGVLQGGFFYKTLNNPIYLTATLVNPGTPQATYIQQSINGPSAYIYGVEMAWEQRLSRLPWLLNGLGVAANYSYTTSRADFPVGFSPAAKGQTGRIDHPHLQRQAPNTWNLGFTYDKARFSMRFAVSHNDENIYAYQYLHDSSVPGVDSDPILGIKGPLGDQYLYAHTQVDIQGSYRLYKGLSFIASGLNLTNEVFGFYTGSPIYPNQREFYHPSLILGMRWSSSVEQ